MQARGQAPARNCLRPTALAAHVVHRGVIGPILAAQRSNGVSAFGSMSQASASSSGSSLTSAGTPLVPTPLRSRVNGAASKPWVACAAATAVAERATVNIDVGRYRCHSKDGVVVSATSEVVGDKVVIAISASYDNVPYMEPAELQLHWGMYRASAARWHHPKEALPPGSQPEPASGAMRTPMAWQERSGAWGLRFEVPAKLAPLHLAFSLYNPATNTYDTPARAAHFCVPVGMSAGTPDSLGASVVATRPGPNPTDPRDAVCAVNFAVFSRHASSLQLCLVRVAHPEAGGANMVAQSVLEVVLDPLTNRTGDAWHVCIHGLKDLETMCWAWRADGEILWQNGNRFHPGFMLADPWATRVVPVALPEGAHRAAPRTAPQQPAGEPVLLGSLAAFVEAPFEWQGRHQAVRGGQSRVRPLEQGVLLEVDVRRFTSGPDAEAAVPPQHRGKYLGVLDRLDALRASGATAVLLSGPVALSGEVGEGRRAPLSLLAPDPALAVGGPLAAGAELKELVAGLHAAGLEVLLQVEFCVTAEGGDAGAGRLQGLRGLDHAVYYRDGVDAPVLNCGHPLVRSLVRGALRQWAEEYRVEGFCFANADNLTQDAHGSVLDSPPLAEELSADPVLRNLRLIAAVGNPALLPRLAERGFPHWGVWAQLNDRFAADMRAYLIEGRRGVLSAVATRITGSGDLFAPRWDAGLPGGLAVGRRPAFGVNAVTPLGDVPLASAFGPAGAEGDAVRAEALSRSLLLAQFVSAGQPLVASATLARPAAAQLVAALSAVRRGYGGLLCPPGLAAERALTWHSAYGGGGEPDWAGANPDPAANVLVLTIGGGAARPGHMLLVALNPGGAPVGVALPRPPPGAVWRLLVDTVRPGAAVAQSVRPGGGGASLGVVLPAAEQGSYTVGPYGGLLLDAVPAAGAAPLQQAASAAAAAPPPQPRIAAPAAAAQPASARPVAPPPGYGLPPAAVTSQGGPPPRTGMPYKAT